MVRQSKPFLPHTGSSQMVNQIDEKSNSHSRYLSGSINNEVESEMRHYQYNENLIAENNEDAT